MFLLGPTLSWRHKRVSKSFWEIGNDHPKSIIKTVKDTWIVKNHWSEAYMKNPLMFSHTSYLMRCIGIVQYFNHHLATVTVTIMKFTILYYKWSKTVALQTIHYIVLHKMLYMCWVNWSEGILLLPKNQPLGCSRACGSQTQFS